MESHKEIVKLIFFKIFYLIFIWTIELFIEIKIFAICLRYLITVAIIAYFYRYTQRQLNKHFKRSINIPIETKIFYGRPVHFSKYILGNKTYDYVMIYLLGPWATPFDPNDVNMAWVEGLR